MNRGQPISTFLIIVTILTIGTLLIGSNYFANANGALWSDYHSMKNLTQAIEGRKVNDDNINWQKFKTSDIYQDAGNNTQKCLKLAHKVGNNIADNEIVHCSKNVKYFKQKYSKVNKTNSTNMNGLNSTNNVTSADTNVTGSITDTNGTSADTNVTGSNSDSNATSSYNATSADTTDTNVIGSNSDSNATSSYNATSADTNAAVTSFDTNATIGNSNMTRSSPDTNATITDANVTSADIS